MSAYMQRVGIKLFREHLEQYTPPDPLYEYYNDTKGKQRRKKRDVPLGISSRDARILKTVQRRARCLDKSFNLCGLRFGWTFIIGIVPGAGDVVCAALNYVLVVRKAREADLPPWLVTRMLLNNTVSALGGAVPFVGDIVIAVYKANSRNAILLEEFLRVRGEECLKLQAEREEQGRRSGGADASGVSQKGKQRTSELCADRGRFVEIMND